LREKHVDQKKSEQFHKKKEAAGSGQQVSKEFEYQKSRKKGGGKGNTDVISVCDALEKKKPQCETLARVLPKKKTGCKGK